MRCALEKRKHYILENLESVTMKKLRATLEDDLSLKPDDLKPFKQLIANYVDTLMSKQEKGGMDTKQAKNNENEQANVRSKANSSSAPRIFSKKVQQLRYLCRQATIPIPPSIYAKNKADGEVAVALEALLEKHGLRASSNSQDAAKVKAKLQLQRDLDGIDTSNIISEGRRNRRGCCKTNYRQVALLSPLPPILGYFNFSPTNFTDVLFCRAMLQIENSDEDDNSQDPSREVEPEKHNQGKEQRSNDGADSSDEEASADLEEPLASDEPEGEALVSSQANSRNADQKVSNDADVLTEKEPQYWPFSQGKTCRLVR